MEKSMRIRLLAPLRFISLSLGFALSIVSLRPSSLGAQTADTVSLNAANRIELSLDKALELVERENPDMRAALIALNAALREHQARFNAYLPSLSARMSGDIKGNFISKAEGSAEGSSSTAPTSLGLKIDMSLPLGSDIGFDIKQKTYDLEAQGLSLAMLKAQLRRDTRKAYLALVKAEEDIELRRRAIRLAQDRFTRTKARYEAGFSSEQEFLRAELNVQTLSPALLQAQSDKRKLMLALARILGYQGDVELIVSASLKDISGPAEPEQASQAQARLDSHAQLRKADIDMAGLKNNLEKARRSLLPAFSAGLSWSTSVKGVFEAESWQKISDSASLSLGLSLPIDSWLPRSKAELARAKIEDGIRSAEIKRKTSLQGLNDSLDQLVSDIELHKATMESNQRAIDLSRRALDWSRQAWEQGRAGIKELEDAEEALFSAENNLISNRQKYLLSLCDLAYILEQILSE